jgi:hypothetical protein
LALGLGESTAPCLAVSADGREAGIARALGDALEPAWSAPLWNGDAAEVNVAAIDVFVAFDARGAVSMTSVEPESPPTDRPKADPELPVRHSTEIDPQVLVRLMAHVPVPPEVTMVDDRPPTPGMARSGPAVPAPALAGPDAMSSNAEPESPPVAVPAAGPELPVIQITETVAMTLTKKMTQLPVAPDAITAIAVPPAPLVATPDPAPAPAPPDAPPPDPAARSVAEPDRPPYESPLAPPELPVMQTTVSAARMLTRWMMQLPVRPVVTLVVALPPLPLDARSGTPPALAPSLDPGSGPAMVPWPGVPPEAVAATDPTVPGVQLTDSAAAALEVVNTQLPWVPGVATAADAAAPAVAGSVGLAGAAAAELGGPLPVAGMIVTAPESPPRPTPTTLPESPVVQVTDRALVRSVTLMLQSPLAPEVGSAMPGPPSPEAAVFDWLGSGWLVPGWVGGPAAPPAPVPE